jgi:hypothetical protein
MTIEELRVLEEELYAQPGMHGHRESNAIDPSGWRKLPQEVRTLAVEWARTHFVPAKQKYRGSTYGLKHEFAANLPAEVKRRLSGGYMSSGQFKMAMLEAGFEPIDVNKNFDWHYRIKPSKLYREEK